MTPRIIVIGKNYSTPLGVVRSLGKAGYDVDVVYISGSGSIQSTDSVVTASKYVGRRLVVEGKDDEIIISSLINDYATESNLCVLFPTDDYSASLIDCYREKLEQRFWMPHLVSGSVVEMMDKTRQSKLACESGFQVPQEWIVSLDQKDLSIPPDIVFPCFIKPLLSAKGGKSELSRCDSIQELENKLLRMQERMRERSVLIQQYLDIDQEYTIGGVCNDQEVYIPSVIKKQIVAQHYRGITLSGTMVANKELGDLYPIIIAFLRNLRFVGMFDIEVHHTNNGFYFGEMNFRCGGPSYSYFRCGVNLPLLAVKVICGEDINTDSIKISLGQTFLNNKVAWEDFAYLFLSYSELKRLYHDSDFSLLSDDEDLDPERIFEKKLKPQYLKKHIKNRIKKVLRDGWH